MPGKPCEASQMPFSLVARLRGTWSDATTSIVPSATAAHSASRSSRVLNGGFAFPIDPMSMSIVCVR